jgi:hypothetical protein
VHQLVNRLVVVAAQIAVLIAAMAPDGLKW